jgi:hypothetical protein
MGAGSATGEYGECRVNSASAGISAGIPESAFDWVSALLRQSAAGLLKSLRFHLPFFSFLLFVAVYLYRLSDAPYMFPNIDNISNSKHVGFVHSRKLTQV